MSGLSFPALDAFAATQFQGQQLLLDAADKQATIDSKQAQTAATLQQNEAQKQAQADRQSLSQYMQSQQALQGAKAANASDTSKRYQQAAQYAADHGDFNGAKTMSDLAKGADDLATKEQTLVEKANVDKAQALSAAAQDALANPTPENHKALFAKAIDSGVDPTTIPVPGTTAYAAFLNQSALGAMKGDARLKFIDEQKNREAQLKAQQEAADQRHEDAEQARKDRAVAREQSAAFQRESLAIRKQVADQAKERDAMKAPGATGPDGYKKLSATVERQTIAVTNAANEASAALERMSVMNAADRASAFSHLEDGTTVLKALTQTGTNKLNPARIQMMQANQNLLGMEVAQAMAAPYKPGEKQISEARNMVEVRSGDTEWTAMYKMALTADVLRTRLQSTEHTATLKEARATADGRLSKFPSANEVYAAAQAKGIDLGKKPGSFMDKLKTTFAAPPDTEPAGDFQPEAKPAPGGPTKAQLDLLHLYSK